MDTITTRDRERIGLLDRTLYWFSTAIPAIIHQSKSDANRARIIGIGVLFTFLYACVAWIYFWSVTVSSPWLYVPLGVFLGFGILTIDRMLIASIKADRIRFVPTAFRVILALALGAFIAQPVILWMFQEDLKGEIALLNDAKVEERNQQLLEIKAAKSLSLNSEKLSLQSILDQKYQDVNEARLSYQQEIDGTGGSKRYGIKEVAKEKGKILERQENEYVALKKRNESKLDSLNTTLLAIERDYQKEIADYQAGYKNLGFLIQVEALQSLIKKDTTGALQNRYLLLLVILILFELVPIISKIFLPTGSYDNHLALIEKKEIETFKEAFEQEQSFNENYKNGAILQDKRLLVDYFKKSDDIKTSALEKETSNWDSRSGGSLKQRVKEIIMS